MVFLCNMFRGWLHRSHHWLWYSYYGCCSTRTIRYSKLWYLLSSYYEILVPKGCCQRGRLDEWLSNLDNFPRTAVFSIASALPLFVMITVILIWKAHGSGASCVVDYPKDSEIFEVFESYYRCDFKYRMDLLVHSLAMRFIWLQIPCLKALAVAKKTQVRINAVFSLRSFSLPS